MRPLIHIGYHKTASSWLQRRVFPHAPGLSFVAGPYRESKVNLHRLFFSGTSFDYDEEKARSALTPKFKAAREAGLVPAISYERFSGSPNSGGHDSKLIAQRIASLFPDAQILLVIREQADMLVSLYKQYIQAGGGASFGQFIGPRVGAGSVDLFRLDYLEYHRLTSYYRDLFGGENVLVLPYEVLVRDPAEFLRRIGDFAGADLGNPPVERQKQSLSAAALYAARRGNQLFALTKLNPAPPFPMQDGYARVRRLSQLLETRIPPSLKARTEERWRDFARTLASDRYLKSNDQIQEYLHDDLAGLGYKLTSH